jgi:hypothetical protein
MLISLTIENWQSFRDQTKLSMLASRERQHSERVPKNDKYKIGILPVAAIYGGNASGKTKLFNALAFAKIFVSKVTQPEALIAREHFQLDSKCAKNPTKFSFELLIENVFYEFSFTVTDTQVTEEKLIKLVGSKEKPIYYRILERPKPIEILDSTLKKDQRLQFVAEGTRENQLFLTNTIDQKIDHFKKIYDWFKHNLTLISPNTSFAAFGQFMQKESPLHVQMNSALASLDTGITRLGGENIPIANLFLPEELKIKISEELQEGESAHLSDSLGNRIVLTKKNGVLSAQKLVSYHKSSTGKEVPFDLRQESVGTLRMIDLLPGFFTLCDPKVSKVFVVDELDRCLHTLLTRTLLETFFSSCTHETRSQLLFTTHDASLIDQKLFRRDEIWVTERDQHGITSLSSFGEYKNIRFDKDIRKSYLQGHLGGIPKIDIIKYMRK